MLLALPPHTPCLLLVPNTSNESVLSTGYSPFLNFDVPGKVLNINGYFYLFSVCFSFRHLSFLYPPSLCLPRTVFVRVWSCLRGSP